MLGVTSPAVVVVGLTVAPVGGAKEQEKLVKKFSIRQKKVAQKRSQLENKRKL
jgi:hypothetical protein